MHKKIFFDCMCCIFMLENVTVLLNKVWGLESDVTLPDGALTLNSMVKLEDGSLRLCYYRADDGQMYADSKDGGKTWETPVSIGNHTLLLLTAGQNKGITEINLSDGSTLRTYEEGNDITSLAVAVLLNGLRDFRQGIKRAFLFPIAIPVASVVLPWKESLFLIRPREKDTVYTRAFLKVPEGKGKTTARQFLMENGLAGIVNGEIIKDWIPDQWSDFDFWTKK